MITTLDNLFENATPTGAVTVTVAYAPAITDSRAVLTVLASRLTVSLPITSPKVEYTALADDWVEIPRPGRKPLLVRRGGKLRKLKLQVEVANSDPTVVEQTLMLLSFVASSAGTDGGLSVASPVVLAYAPMDSRSWLTMTGYWQLTDLTITSNTRQHVTNGVTWASAAVELTENSDPPSLSGVPLFAPGQILGPSDFTILPPVGSPVSVVVAQAGDTLFTIAVRVYGAAEPGWRWLAFANGIMDPRAVSAGQALRVEWPA